MTSTDPKMLCLLGHNVNSISPNIHNEQFKYFKIPYAYFQINVETKNLGIAVSALKNLNFAGANVTIPHKERIIKYLDRIDANADKTGAVNTIIKKGNKLIGYNTDIDGFSTPLKRTNHNIKNRKVLIFGAGGASRAITYSLLKNKCENITIINRNLKKAKKVKNHIEKSTGVKIELLELNRKNLKNIDKYNLIINCTPIDIGNKIEKFSYEFNDTIAYDLIYRPIETNFLKKMKMSKVKTIPGYEMLIEQARLSFELWTKRKVNKELMKKTALKELKRWKSIRAKAEVHGAITVLNALSNNQGAAIGIDLKTSADVELTEKQNTINVIIKNSKKEDKKLAIESVKTVFKEYNIKKYGANVIIESNIPIGKGLKSSSAAANAIILATTKALRKRIIEKNILKLSVEAARKAGVTITGALDDASASYLGGFVLTDNKKDIILKHKKIDSENIEVILYVPEKKIYTKNVDRKLLNPFKETMKMAFNIAKSGDYYTAMTLNGIVHCNAFSMSREALLISLKNNAFASSLSGTGPAVASICDKRVAKKIKRDLKLLGGEIIETKINNKKGSIING